MKEDKIIKDLKELNHKLKRQNVLLESKVWNAERRLEELKEENKKLKEELKEMNKDE